MWAMPRWVTRLNELFVVGAQEELPARYLHHVYEALVAEDNPSRQALGEHLLECQLWSALFYLSETLL
jgi:hypothetical protein